GFAVFDETGGFGEDGGDAAFGVGDAGLGGDEFVVAGGDGVLLTRQLFAQVGGIGGDFSLAPVRAFKLGDESAVLVLEELGALGFDFEAGQHRLNVLVVVARKRLAVEHEGARGVAADDFAGGFELARFLAQFAIAHAQLLGEVGAFLFEFEDAAASLGLALLEF